MQVVNSGGGTLASDLLKARDRTGGALFIRKLKRYAIANEGAIDLSDGASRLVHAVGTSDNLAFVASLGVVLHALAKFVALLRQLLKLPAQHIGLLDQTVLSDDVGLLLFPQRTALVVQAVQPLLELGGIESWW